MALGSVADFLEVTERTVRRWCERCLIPGAYRGRAGKGHWRVPTKSLASLTSEDFRAKYKTRHRMNARRRQWEIRFPGLTQGFEEIMDPLNESNLATEIYFAFKYNLSQGELLTKLTRNEEELARDLRRTELAVLHKKIPDVYRRMARDPYTAHLYLAGRRLTFKQVAITATALALELGISRASFYRRYQSGWKKVLLAERQAAHVAIGSLYSESVEIATPSRRIWQAVD